MNSCERHYYDVYLQILTHANWQNNVILILGQSLIACYIGGEVEASTTDNIREFASSHED